MSAETDGDESAAELRERVDELESKLDDQEEQLEEQQETIRAMLPSRRDLLKAAGGGAAGVGLGALLTGGASAGSQSTGTIGTQDSPIDAYLEDAYDHNGNQPLSLPGDGTVNVTDSLDVTNSVDASTLNTDDLSVTNAPYLLGDEDNLRAESGVVTSSNTLSGASDGTWDTSNFDELPVSFGKSFSATPVVFAEIDTGNTGGAIGIIARPVNTTQSGFDARLRNYSTTDSPNQSVNWLAIGPD